MFFGIQSNGYSTLKRLVLLIELLLWKLNALLWARSKHSFHKLLYPISLYLVENIPTIFPPSSIFHNICFLKCLFQVTITWCYLYHCMIFDPSFMAWLICSKIFEQYPKKLSAILWANSLKFWLPLLCTLPLGSANQKCHSFECHFWTH